jgi:hypothetical protein
MQNTSPVNVFISLTYQCDTTPSNFIRTTTVLVRFFLDFGPPHNLILYLQKSNKNQNTEFYLSFLTLLFLVREFRLNWREIVGSS